MSSQALELISAAASNASSARAEYTTAAPALTETATPSTSASSCLVAPRSRAAVAAQRNGNSKRYEFAGLFIEVTGLLAGPPVLSVPRFIRCFEKSARTANWPCSRGAKSVPTRSNTRQRRASRKRSGSPAPSPTSSSEIATITARGLAGQPMKCGGERAGLAEADLERNRGDGPLAIRQ